MSLITVSDITLEGSMQTLFENVSFSINPGDRIGLIGNNGSGKSTLLKCIMGEEQVQSGKISVKNGLRISNIEQDLPKELEDLTLYEVIEEAIPEDERVYSGYKVDLALESLGATEEIQLKTMRELSGGWRRLALIARTNLDDPDVILLDEPTNHLDIGKVLRLENWLHEMVVAPYLVISHDREFLDRVTKKTFFLRGGKMHTFNHPYSRAVAILAEEDAAAEAQRASQETKIQQLSNTAKRFKQQAQGHGSERLARTAMSLESRIDRMESELVDVYKEDERHIRLAERELDSNRPVIKIEDITICVPGGEDLFHIDYLEIKRGDRIAIMGLNGTGKSLFLKNIMEEYSRFKQNPRIYVPQGITFNSQVEIGYLDQELSTLPADVSLLDYVQSRFILDHTRSISVLASAGFSRQQQESKISSLSYGEKVRLAFAALRIHQPNTFILDEPTNHLDVDGQARLVATINDIDAPCFLVSHDRRFIAEVANKYFVISAGRLEQIDDPQYFYRAAYDLVSNSGVELDIVQFLHEGTLSQPPGFMSDMSERGLGR